MHIYTMCNIGIIHTYIYIIYIYIYQVVISDPRHTECSNLTDGHNIYVIIYIYIYIYIYLSKKPLRLVIHIHLSTYELTHTHS